MEKVIIRDKVYTGEKIFTHKRENFEVKIYALNIISDKYAVIVCKDKKIYDFIVTGLDKVYKVIELCQACDIETLRQELATKINNLRNECWNKKLNRIDQRKLRPMLPQLYDEEYAKFIILAVPFPQFQKEATNLIAC